MCRELVPRYGGPTAEKHLQIRQQTCFVLDAIVKLGVPSPTLQALPTCLLARAKNHMHLKLACFGRNEHVASCRVLGMHTLLVWKSASQHHRDVEFPGNGACGSGAGDRACNAQQAHTSIQMCHDCRQHRYFWKVCNVKAVLTCTHLCHKARPWIAPEQRTASALPASLRSRTPE